MVFEFTDNYLKLSKSEFYRSEIRQKIDLIKEAPGKIEEKLDKWLYNFNNVDEKELAIKLFLNIDYYSKDKVDNTLLLYKNKISQYLSDRNLAWSDVRIIITDKNADSSHFFSYILTKAWDISQSSVLKKMIYCQQRE